MFCRHLVSVQMASMDKPRTTHRLLLENGNEGEIEQATWMTEGVRTLRSKRIKVLRYRSKKQRDSAWKRQQADLLSIDTQY